MTIPGSDALAELQDWVWKLYGDELKKKPEQGAAGARNKGFRIALRVVRNEIIKRREAAPKGEAVEGAAES